MYGGFDNNEKGFLQKDRDIDDFDKAFFSKISLDFWLENGYTKKDLQTFLQCNKEEIKKKGGVPDGIPIFTKPIPFDRLESMVRQKCKDNNMEKRNE